MLKLTHQNKLPFIETAVRLEWHLLKAVYALFSDCEAKVPFFGKINKR